MRVHEAASGLARCYNTHFGEGRVFVIRNPISVYWGHISVLDADLVKIFFVIIGKEGDARTF